MSDFSFLVNPEATASFHDEGIVIFHIGSGRMYTSNGTGARIWRAVERRLPLEVIAEEISSTYQIDPATAHEHTVRFLAELERHVLVQREVAS